MYSAKVEKLFDELDFFTDPQNERGFRAFINLIEEQREEAMQYVKADDETFQFYASRLVRANLEVASQDDYLLSSLGE